MEHTILYLVMVAIVIGFSVAMIVMYKTITRKHQEDIEILDKDHKIAQTRTKTLGRSEVRGELNELLGTFKLLNEYDQLAIISSVSKQASLDLLGIKNDTVDFIEIKSLKTGLSKPEKNVKKLIDEGKVRYVVIEGNLPKYFETKERE